MKRGKTATMLKRTAAVLACSAACTVALAALPACGGSGSGSAGGAVAAVGGGGQASGAEFTQPADIAVPPANAGGIDTSGVNEGWVCASAASGSRLKFQVVCGDMTYNYDLPNDGTPTLFPINMGNGSYQFRIMQNQPPLQFTRVDHLDSPDRGGFGSTGK